MTLTQEQKAIAARLDATRALERATRDVRELERLLEDAKDRYAYAVDKYETVMEEKE